MTDVNKPDEKFGLQKLMDSVAGTGEEKSSSSWPVTVFLLGMMVLILSVLGIKLALTKRKAAELARKLREQEEAQKRAKEDEQMADNAAARKEAQEALEELAAKIQETKDEMAGRQFDHEEYVKELKGVSSWDQIVVVDARNPNDKP